MCSLKLLTEVPGDREKALRCFVLFPLDRLSETQVPG